MTRAPRPLVEVPHGLFVTPLRRRGNLSPAVKVLANVRRDNDPRLMLLVGSDGLVEV